jgi:hypothetical protein
VPAQVVYGIVAFSGVAGLCLVSAGLSRRTVAALLMVVLALIMVGGFALSAIALS